MNEVKDGEVADVTKTKQQNEEGNASVASEETNGTVDGETTLSINELESTRAERDGYLDQLQRTLAEFANYRRRVEQERVQAREFATKDLLRQIGSDRG